ncbi:MAG: ATP-binding cassette domain-containing protein [Pseudonocardiaceae bacterium]|nr:ATP-binding cassette domain-containing protein [Pseudonocardiaceae bacterium]
MPAARDVDEPVLSVDDLVVEVDTPYGRARPVDEVSFEVARGETVAIVGESGCGKTMTALAVLGLLPKPGARVAGGRIRFVGRDLLGLSGRELRRIRGSAMSMIFQEPVSALNPVFTIGQQISDVLRAHDPALTRPAARRRAVELLADVGVPGASSRVDEYPNQWSGGMCQRALIAMAIANRPELLIADEPTTALDVTIQAQVLEVLRAAQRTAGAATLLITHDLGVVAEMADRVVVMYGGRVVETASAEEIFSAPRHPYTLGLLTSLPRVDTDLRRLLPIPGQPPQLGRIPVGCSFHPRCHLRRNRARCVDEDPALAAIRSPGRRTACHFHDEMRDEVTNVAAELGADVTTAVRGG